MKHIKASMKIVIGKSLSDIKKCYAVIVQLRTALSKDEFIKKVNKQQKSGYMLVFIKDKDKVMSVAGFRITENLAHGKFMYIDDFVTDNNNRSKGYGDKLFDFLIDYAKKETCKELHLDSGVQRFEAHRFYFRKRMAIVSHHFSLPITK